MKRQSCANYLIPRGNREALKLHERFPLFALKTCRAPIARNLLLSHELPGVHLPLTILISWNRHPTRNMLTTILVVERERRNDHHSVLRRDRCNIVPNGIKRTRLVRNRVARRPPAYRRGNAVSRSDRTAGGVSSVPPRMVLGRLPAQRCRALRVHTPRSSTSTSPSQRAVVFPRPNRFWSAGIAIPGGDGASTFL
jgi:hypothetical protein